MGIGPVRLGDVEFEVVGVLGGLGCVFHAREGEDLLQECPVAVAEGFILRLEVIVPVAHGEPALAEVEDVGVAVLHVGMMLAISRNILAFMADFVSFILSFSIKSVSSQIKRSTILLF